MAARPDEINVSPLAGVIRDCLNRQWVKTVFVEPGSPWENVYIVSVKKKLRDELLNRKFSLHWLKQGS